MYVDDGYLSLHGGIDIWVEAAQEMIEKGL